MLHFKMRVFLTVLMCGLIIALEKPVSAGQDTFVFCSINQPDSRLYQISEAILGEAFKRMGLHFVLVTYPAKRCPIEIDSGKVDGDSHRIYEFNEQNQYPNLIRVDESIQEVDQSVFTKLDTITVDGWQSLAPYRIIYLAGIRSTELGMDIAGIPLERRIPVYTIDKGFELIHRDRADVLVVSPSTGRITMKKLGLTSREIKMLYPPVVRIKLYPWMNIKHLKTAEALSHTLKKMKIDGSYQRLINTIPE